MKKLGKRVLILIISTILLVTAIDTVWRMDQWNKSKYKKMPDEIAVANTGSSHGELAFVYEEYDMETFNFAMSSQSLQYDYRLIDFYSEHFSEDSVLFIVISWFSLWYDEINEEDFESKNLRYYAVLDTDHIRLKRDEHYYRNRFWPCITYINSKMGSIFWEGNNIVETQESKPTDTGENLESKEENLEDAKDQDVSHSTIWSDSGKARAAYHLRYMVSDTGQVLPVPEDNQKAITELIELCQRNGIVPIIVTTPYLKEYSDNFPEEVLQVYYEMIYGICNKYKVQYWDFSRDERFCGTKEFFSDTDHLNEEGAKEFTKLIMDKISDSV